MNVRYMAPTECDLWDWLFSRDSSGLLRVWTALPLYCQEGFGPQCGQVSLFNHSPLEVHLGCFPCLALINKAAQVQDFV